MDLKSAETKTKETASAGKKILQLTLPVCSDFWLEVKQHTGREQGTGQLVSLLSIDGALLTFRTVQEN